MTPSRQLLTASFKNHPLRVVASNTVGGRKTATHEFVNSSRRIVEDLGPQLKTYELTVEIGGPTFLADYLALTQLLDRAGEGQLVHPTQGLVNCVPKSYTVDESQRDTGLFVVKITFEQSDNDVNPLIPIVGVGEIIDSVDAVLDQCVVDIDDGFVVAVNHPSAFESARQIGLDLADAVSGVQETLESGLATVSAFNASVSAFRQDVSTLINTPLALGNAMSNILVEFSALVTTPRDRLRVLRGLFGFNDQPTKDTNSDLNSITAEGAEAVDNQKLMVRLVRYSALALSYRAVVESTFNTIDELTDAADQLNAQYDVVAGDTFTPLSTLCLLQSLRVSVDAYLEQQRLSIGETSTVTVAASSALLLSYGLYGDTTRAVEIQNLNSLINPTTLTGTVVVLDA